VSPEPERRSRETTPQGRFRKQVEQGSISELLAETNGPYTTSELSYFFLGQTSNLGRPNPISHGYAFRNDNAVSVALASLQP
jgi:hypothetical protein